MNQKTFFKTSGWIFGLIAALHACRLVQGWPAEIGGWIVPMWASMLAVVIGGYLSWTAFRLSK